MLPGYVTSIILHILVVVFHSREAWVFRAVFVLQTCGCIYIPLCSATALESESRVCSMRVREGRWEREREVSRRIGLGTLNRPNSTVDSSCEWHKFIWVLWTLSTMNTCEFLVGSE